MLRSQLTFYRKELSLIAALFPISASRLAVSRVNWRGNSVYCRASLIPALRSIRMKLVTRGSHSTSCAESIYKVQVIKEVDDRIVVKISNGKVGTERVNEIEVVEEIDG